MVLHSASTPPTGLRKQNIALNSAASGGTTPTSRAVSGGISYPSPPATHYILSPVTGNGSGSGNRVPSSPVDMTRASSTASTATTVSMRSQQGFTPTTASAVASPVPKQLLPPKSPASINGRRLLPSVPSSSSLASPGSRGRASGRSRRGRSRSSSRGSRRSSSRGSRRSRKEDDDDDDTSDNESEQLPKAPANAGSVSVDTDSDDLSGAEDFSLITFNTKPSPSESVNGNRISQSSVADPLSGLVDGPGKLHRIPVQQQLQRRHHHRRNRSWDSLGSNEDYDSLAAASQASSSVGTKSCLALPKILQRNRQRVQVADVASVGNASDTLVPAENGRITGRELHESAKALLNDGEYEQALNMFAAILDAQIGRFGSEEHSSVGAALHNVGVVRLRMGDHMIAEEVLLRAAAIRRRVLEKGHLDLAVSCGTSQG